MTFRLIKKPNYQNSKKTLDFFKKSIVGSTPCNFIIFFVSVSTEKGGSKPASNKPEDEKEDEKSSEFKYENDEIGSSHLRTKDGGVPSEDQLRQYAVKGLELLKSVQQQIEEMQKKEEEEKNNQQQNKK